MQRPPHHGGHTPQAITPAAGSPQVALLATTIAATLAARRVTPREVRIGL